MSKTIVKKITVGAILAVMCSVLSFGQNENPISYTFEKKYGQVEVGGPYAGVEFHKSNPLPSRISFYYPVANSIDVSTDYWKRERSRPMAVGIQVGQARRKWIGREGWNYTLSPNSVTFFDRDSLLSYQMRYEFCMNEPAMVFSFEIKNESLKPQSLSVYSHLLLALRTCQTYARKDSAMMTIKTKSGAVLAQFNDTDTKETGLFVLNAGEQPAGIWDDADELSATDDGNSRWIGLAGRTRNSSPTNPRRRRAIAAFEYSHMLQPGESLKIIQIIGTAQKNEAEKELSIISKNWQSQVSLYNEYIKKRSSTESQFTTGDRIVDRSVVWAKSILAANAHYLNGTIVPMPCPAEYNFYFTHDLLMTNLGAVNFDLERVKKNLRYVVSLAKDSIIPHAYYWRDKEFQTELCFPSNWNHFWFIEVSAAYLRHSFDTVTVRMLYPLISKSLTEVLKQKKDDNLMYAFRPDWWDIGWKEGPRTYTTALTVRAIDDYLYIASCIDHKNRNLIDLEHTSRSMRSALSKKLWDDSLNYLINYNDSTEDTHLYMGSLIAPAFHLLDREKSEKLIHTAQKVLFAPKVGIRAVMPADFATDSLIKYFKFAGDEAGQAYYYINGGVWPHNNAWYALALNSIGRSDEALAMMKQTMTVDGIAQSPNGYPAMYEYRFSDETSPEYGKIDKPSFLWAGGFYLYTLYSISGFSDNVWNLSVGGNHARFDSPIQCSYEFGRSKNVTINGYTKTMHALTGDGRTIPSLVLPLDILNDSTLSVTYGSVTDPYIAGTNAIVYSAVYHAVGKKLECSVSSFEGHRVTMTVVSATLPRSIDLDGKSVKQVDSRNNIDGSVTTNIRFTAASHRETIQVGWE